MTLPEAGREAISILISGAVAASMRGKMRDFAACLHETGLSSD